MSSNVLKPPVFGAQPESQLDALPDRIQFDRAEVRVTERQLLIEGRAVPVGNRAFDMLLELLARHGRLVTKAELLDSVWAGLVVEENNIPTQVSTLRKWLGPEAIVTIPGRGYRFVAAVRDEAATVAGQPIANASAKADPLTSSPVARHGTLERPPPLIGRAADLDALSRLVAEGLVVTVTGAGGVGKTRLVQSLCRDADVVGRYRHGVCWLSLAPISAPEVLPGAIADALGVSLSSGEPMAQLLDALTPLSLLLVLDNAEHLLDATRTAVKAIERVAPEVHIVVTSQAPLQLREEVVYRLRGLEVPAVTASADEARLAGSVCLFVERAMAADARFWLVDSEVATVVEICRALDGLALAIELAAARVGLLGLDALALSLSERLQLLASPSLDEGPARQRTLRAAIEWSYDLLGAEEQILFRRLAVFPASASLDALQTLLVGSGMDRWRLLDSLSTLVDRSLVEVTGGHDGEGPPRYRMLESPRIFAAERLAEADETSSLHSQHAAVMARLFEQAYAARWDGHGRLDRWREALRAELDSGRAAFAWAVEHGDRVAAMTIGATLLQAVSWSLHSERAAIVAALKPDIADESLPPALRLRTAFEVCAVALGSRADDMRAIALQAVDLARRLGDQAQLYATTSLLACASARLGDSAGAEAALTEMRELEDPSWAPQRLALGADAEYLAARSDPARAIELSRRQMALNRLAGGNTWMALLNIVDAELVAGNVEAAVEYGDELLEQLRDSRDERGWAYALLNLTSVWLAMRDGPKSTDMAQRGWAIGPRFDLQAFWADVLALVAARDGRMRQAARLAGYSNARYRQHQDVRAGNEAKAYAEAVGAARAALGDPLYERLAADGETLSDADVAEHAFAAVDR